MQTQKKIEETDAIFEQLKEENSAADADDTVLRLSLDALPEYGTDPSEARVAVDAAEGVIRLVDVATGREHVRLTAPGEQRYFPSAFSPDGTLLVVLVSDSLSLYLWDLRPIRAYLQELDLDWDLPPFPPASSTDPLRLELVDN